MAPAKARTRSHGRARDGRPIPPVWAQQPPTPPPDREPARRQRPRVQVAGVDRLRQPTALETGGADRDAQLRRIADRLAGEGVSSARVDRQSDGTYALSVAERDVERARQAAARLAGGRR